MGAGIPVSAPAAFIRKSLAGRWYRDGKGRVTKARTIGGWLIFAVLVVVAGAGGVLVGGKLRGHVPWPGRRTVTERVPDSLLEKGMALPDVDLVVEDGSSVRLADLIAGRGRVVLFLDLECPACVEMAAKWRRAIDDGRIDADRVIGIAFYPPEYLDDFRLDNDLSFMMASDTTRVFLDDFGVTRFPLEVIVDGKGLIRSMGHDSRSGVDVELLARFWKR